MSAPRGAGRGRLVRVGVGGGAAQDYVESGGEFAGGGSFQAVEVGGDQ